MQTEQFVKLLSLYPFPALIIEDVHIETQGHMARSNMSFRFLTFTQIASLIQAKIRFYPLSRSRGISLTHDFLENEKKKFPTWLGLPHIAYVHMYVSIRCREGVKFSRGVNK